MRNGWAKIEGCRINQPASIPGKKAPPTQFSSAARSSPSGVMGATGGTGGGVETGAMKLPSNQRLSNAYWVGVTERRTCALTALYGSSPSNLGMFGNALG